MKKCYILLFFALLVQTAQSQQISFFNYYDYSCEWKRYGGGWNGIYSFEEYATTYFDGDSLINGTAYYRNFRKVKTINYPNGLNGPTVVEEQLWGPGYVREDEAGKIWYYNPISNTEQSYFDNQLILDASIGDAFPNNTDWNCTVQSEDFVTLNGNQLRYLGGALTGPGTGMIEGIGQLGPVCSLGIEGNYFLNCFTKGGETLQFYTQDCSLFPNPNRQFLNTPGFAVSQIRMYPNPTQGKTLVMLPPEIEPANYEVVSVSGQKVKQGRFVQGENILELSELNSGLYIVNLKGSGFSRSLKIVKQ